MSLANSLSIFFYLLKEPAFGFVDFCYGLFCFFCIYFCLRNICRTKELAKNELNPEEIENLNRPITSTEIETVIGNLLANKSLGPDSFTAELYQKFREEPTPIQLKLL